MAAINMISPAIRSVHRTSAKRSSSARPASRAAFVTKASTGKNTIVDVASSNADFSILVEAVVKANLAGALSGTGPFTVFAPVDPAFVKALGALKLTKAQLLALPNLAEILKFHVVSGKVMSTQLKDGMEAPTLEGGKLKFDLKSGVKVNGANVVKADILCDNGVIHVIDSVMLPPMKPAAYLESLPGVCAPTGLFDPLGFCADKPISEIKRIRESELVHCRVAMLAIVGLFVGENFHPLFNGEITGLAVNHFQQVPSPFWEIVVFFIGLAEAYRVGLGWKSPDVGFQELKDEYVPGNLGFDPLGLKPTSAAELKDVSTKELNNGRLAMLAVAGLIMQEEVTQKTITEQIFGN